MERGTKVLKQEITTHGYKPDSPLRQKQRSPVYYESVLPFREEPKRDSPLRPKHNLKAIVSPPDQNLKDVLSYPIS